MTDTTPRPELSRRRVLTFALAAGAIAPMGLSLTSCAAGGSAAPTSSTTTSAAGGNAGNPFGVKAGSSIDAVIFDGGYGTDYVDFAGKVLGKGETGAAVKLTATTEIAAQMQPRFVAGNPPDLLDNSGANSIPLPTIADQLSDLTDVLDAKNLEGNVIRDIIYPGVAADGMLNGAQKTINYVLTVYSLWYSKSLFDANGWGVPATWDDMMTLGEQARAMDKYLLVWGKEAASYYLPFLLDSAIKEGGDELRIALGNLEPNAWKHPAMKATAEALQAVVKAGYIKPGGEGVQFTKAQASWSNDQEALFYYSGSWIENEMKDQTAKGFTMTAGLVPTVSSSSGYPNQALHVESSEAYVVPAKAANVAGGKELLRVMLSKDAAAEFAKNKLAATIVKDTIPADAFGSSALASQVQLLDGAGTHSFNYPFLTLYGLWSADSNTWLNAFLSGRMDSATLLDNLQKAADTVAADSSIQKIVVS